ncbi:hypothetical protein Barb4_03661 [Bacteroidales bacterium Barb4]|nr:hypothetical protein Barb4_03661 [Bacteroidales bacterium Barb4]
MNILRKVHCSILMISAILLISTNSFCQINQNKIQGESVMEVKSIQEQLIFTTVRIEAILKNAETSTGTGFIFSYQIGEGAYHFLVTNKHVIKGSITGKLEFNIKSQEKVELGNKFSITINDFEQFWIGHDNPDIDIAITPFVPIVNDIKERYNKDLFYKSIPSNYVPTKEVLETIDVIEDIIFIGYPNGLYDQKNLLPIVRKGITATPATIDFNGTSTFLIDASVFPGSSGSPVFLYNAGVFTHKGSERPFAGTRLIFLGILASVYIRQDVNTLEVTTIPAKDIPFVKTSQMIDLGTVFKSSCIVELIESFLKKRGVL